MKRTFDFTVIEELPTKGKLRIKLTKRGVAMLRSITERIHNYNGILAALLSEDKRGSLHYTLVKPENIAALTSAPIITNEWYTNGKGEIIPTETAKVWWFPEYETQDEMALLTSLNGWTLTLATEK